ncbi:hypothetical protein R3P38DRAFT_769252 [Favolaschia claudopus]|uniref:Uncharacterized protein n=1 Tax=Favolaschia claudopus TaxID=2862362 RepID=A0AAW0C0P5_9AGAR
MLLLAVTNTDEGSSFVNQGAEYNVTEYVRNLFPLIGEKESQEVAALYAPIGSPYGIRSTKSWETVSVLRVISGDNDSFLLAIMKCPTDSLLHAFPASSYKAAYAIPPALHGQDEYQLFPFHHSHQRRAYYITIPLSSMLSQTVSCPLLSIWTQTTKCGPASRRCGRNGRRFIQSEMMFNKTELDAPAIAPDFTSSALLKRCEFWNSVRHLTAQ